MIERIEGFFPVEAVQRGAALRLVGYQRLACRQLDMRSPDRTQPTPSGEVDMCLETVASLFAAVRDCGDLIELPIRRVALARADMEEL